MPHCEHINLPARVEIAFSFARNDRCQMKDEIGAQLGKHCYILRIGQRAGYTAQTPVLFQGKGHIKQNNIERLMAGQAACQKMIGKLLPHHTATAKDQDFCHGLFFPCSSNSKYRPEWSVSAPPICSTKYLKRSRICCVTGKLTPSCAASFSPLFRSLR